MAATRALKTQEEISAVPLSEGVVIELPDGVVVPDAATDDVVVEKKAAVEQKDGASILQEQLDAAKAATARAEKQVADERAARVKAEREAAAAQSRVADSESEAVASGLAGAQAEQKAARAALKNAQDTGDSEALADATERLARAASDIRDFERAQAQLSTEREREKERVTTQDRAAPVDPIAAIDANPQLMAEEKTWLKAHSDCMIDPRRNARLGVAYDDAIAKGLIRGTKPYFDHLEQFMGYAKAAPATADSQTEEADVQAPPTRADRDASGRPSGNGTVRLTSEEREIARSMGVSEIDYAKQKVAFDTARRADPERYSGNR